MEKEFNLSERINKYGYNDDGTPDSDILEVESVKEFIRQLKRALDDEKGLSIGWTIDIKEIIDKLAGESLI